MVVSSSKCASKYARLVVFGVSAVSSEMDKALVVDNEEKSVDAVFCERIEISGLGIGSIRKRGTIPKSNTPWKRRVMNLFVRVHNSPWNVRNESSADGSCGWNVCEKLKSREIVSRSFRKLSRLAFEFVVSGVEVRHVGRGTSTADAADSSAVKRVVISVCSRCKDIL